MSGRNRIPLAARGAEALDASAGMFAKGTADLLLDAVTDPDGKVLAPSIRVVQPESAARAEYPLCKAYRTPGGHLVEMDDTPDGRRIHIWHASGMSYRETGDSGATNERHASMHLRVDGSHVVDTGRRIDSAADGRRTHTGGVDVRTDHGCVEGREGDTVRRYVGDVTEHIHGIVTERIVGRREVRVAGPLVLAGTEVALGGKAVQVLAGAGPAEVLARDKASLRSLTGQVMVGGPAATDLAKRALLTDMALQIVADTADAVRTALAAVSAGASTPETVGIKAALAPALASLGTQVDRLRGALSGADPLTGLPTATTRTRAD